MELGNFKKIDFDDEAARPSWLEEESVPALEEAQLKNEEPSTKRVSSLSQFPRRATGDGFAAAPRKHSKRALKETAKGKLATKQPASPAVSIEITMPHFRVPQPEISWRKYRPWLIGAGLLVLLLFGGKIIQERLAKQPTSQQKTPVIVAADLGYKPLLAPATAENQNNTSKPTYDEQRKLYTFNDTFKNARLTVNQQAMPEKLKNNEPEIKRLAASIGATDSFTTTLGTVRIATSKETGTQRLFIVGDKMLMFVQSTSTLSQTEWVEYLQSLE